MRPTFRSDARGFTLVEMLVVLLIISLLLAIAVSSFLGARERGERSVAQANVRAILPAIHTYHVDHSTFVGMTLDDLRTSYDGSLDPSRYSFGDPSNLTDSSYCVQSTQGGETYRKAGPAADIVPGLCP
jgi:prepilin-type N-terminal cleavage/methylation domain-containing protein